MQMSSFYIREFLTAFVRFDSQLKVTLYYLTKSNYQHCKYVRNLPEWRDRQCNLQIPIQTWPIPITYNTRMITKCTSIMNLSNKTQTWSYTHTHESYYKALRALMFSRPISALLTVFITINDGAFNTALLHCNGFNKQCVDTDANHASFSISSAPAAVATMPFTVERSQCCCCCCCCWYAANAGAICEHVLNHWSDTFLVTFSLIGSHWRNSFSGWIACLLPVNCEKVVKATYTWSMTTGKLLRERRPPTDDGVVCGSILLDTQFIS